MERGRGDHEMSSLLGARHRGGDYSAESGAHAVVNREERIALRAAMKRCATGVARSQQRVDHSWPRAAQSSLREDLES